MKNLRTLVVDDEPLARERVVRFLRQEPGIGTIRECANGAEAIAALRGDTYDIMLLDIQMPEADGLAVLRSLPPGRLPVTIFVTAHNTFAVEAFEVNAVDYLLKPFDRTRFRTALQRARDRLASRNLRAYAGQLRTAVASLAPLPPFLERIPIAESDRIWFLPVASVDWFESDGNYIRIHAGRTIRVVRDTMTVMEGRLDPASFIRVHRTAIVNIGRIREVRPLPLGGFALVMHDGTHVPTSRSYRPHLRKRLGIPY